MKPTARSVRRMPHLVEVLEHRRLLAAVPTLVKDINTQAETGSTPYNLFSNGTTSYFTELDVNLGYELWKTDGTSAGTLMVKDINPGPASSMPGNFAQLGSTIFFSASVAGSGTELWKTDGTSAGTMLVKDINPGTASSKPTYLRAAGSTLFFFAETPGATNQLWKSDGTTAGTSMVVPINSDSATQSIWLPSHTAVLGNTYLWLGQNKSSFGLFRSDGTTAGTYLVKAAASDFTPDAIVAGTGRAIIASNQNEAAGVPLYSTDGTTAGTTQIASIATETSFTVIGTNVYYASYDNTNGYRLFRQPVTGTTATQLTTPPGMQQPVNLMPFGQSLLFTAFVNSSGHTGLYQVTGTGTAATLVTNITASANQLYNPTLLGTTLYFINATTKELWKSDGTPGGTSVIATLPGFASYDPSYNPVMMVAVGSRVLVMNRTAETGFELWTTTGTPESFALLKDIDTGTANSSASATGRIGNVLFYSADDGINGAELWRTDGTSAGTYLVKDINPGAANSGPSHGVTLGNRLLFSAYNPANSSDLWITDGTTAGTTPINVPGGEKLPYDSIPVVLNGVAYFNAQTSAAGAELWRSDGTLAGTYMVKDIYAGTASGYPLALTVLNSRLYFIANSSSGQELWASDGTTAGTVLVKDVYAGTSSGLGNAASLTTAAGKLFFVGTDSATGSELWMSDGTPAGTVRVNDLNPGRASSSPGVTYGGNGAMAQVGDMLYFNATTPATGNELFRLNLKTMQTSLAADLVPGIGDSTPTGLKGFGGVLTFSTYSGSALQFYSFDETAGAVKRIEFASGSGTIGPSTIANGALFFAAPGPSGNELYEWDGGSSAVQLIDVQPGPAGSSPGGIVALADALVFTANTYPYGSELRRLADTAAPRAYQTALDLNGAPRVRIDWSESVIANANTVQLISRATNQAVPGVTVIRTVRADGSGVDYSFSSKLPDGNYRLTFNAADFHDAADNVGSGTQQFDFFVLAGDVNHDRVVNFDDLVILAQNYNATGKAFDQGNVDGSADGSVNFDDLVILAQQYNKSFAAPAIAALISSPATPTKKSRVAASVLN